jgi:hypothetical protein
LAICGRLPLFRKNLLDNIAVALQTTGLFESDLSFNIVIRLLYDSVYLFFPFADVKMTVKS